MPAFPKLPIFALLLAIAIPADAGMRALYHGETEPKVLEIEVADNGDFRIGQPGDPAYGLQVDGVYHLVTPGADGKPEVARVEDMAAVLGKAMPPLFAQLFSEAARANPAPPPRMKRAGTRTVAGFPGEVWKVSLGNDQSDVQEIVFSRDPALKPIGVALGRFMESMIVMASPFLGAMAADMIGEMRSVFSVGTALESAGRFQLVKAERADIAPERLALPAPPLTRAEIESRVQTAPAR